MTQQKEILNYIQTHKKGITSKIAIEKFGCTRLAAVIAALEKKGYVFEHSRETVLSRHGKTSVARYKMPTIDVVI